MQKECSRCFEVKPLTEYYRQSGSKDGLKQMCKDCVNEYQKSVTYRLYPFPKPKTYQDYLREAGMTGYYQRYIKHFS